MLIHDNRVELLPDRKLQLLRQGRTETALSRRRWTQLVDELAVVTEIIEAVESGRLNEKELN